MILFEHKSAMIYMRIYEVIQKSLLCGQIFYCTRCPRANICVGVVMRPLYVTPHGFPSRAYATARRMPVGTSNFNFLRPLTDFAQNS